MVHPRLAFIMGENEGIGFHLIFNQWIQLIRFDKRVPNWKARMDLYLVVRLSLKHLGLA